MHFDAFKAQRSPYYTAGSEKQIRRHRLAHPKDGRSGIQGRATSHPITFDEFGRECSHYRQKLSSLDEFDDMWTEWQNADFAKVGRTVGGTGSNKCCWL